MHCSIDDDVLNGEFVIKFVLKYSDMAHMDDATAEAWRKHLASSGHSAHDVCAFMTKLLSGHTRKILPDNGGSVKH